MKITRMRVNHLREAIGFRLSSTMFSWVVEESAGTRATASRIVVTSEGATVADTDWAELDSLAAKVEVALRPRTCYEWTVAVRTDAGEEVISPVEVGREVFAERDDLRERFEQEVREQRLPEEVPVKRGVANRMAKNHRIRTDTGIEITFPSDLVDRPGYIDFTREDDGRLTITISNVARIDNR